MWQPLQFFSATSWRPSTTAGGVRSPLAIDADCADFVAATRPDAVLLVADAGLGTIHAVRCAMAALDADSVQILLNRYDDADEIHRRNCAWLADRDGLSIHTDVDRLLDSLLTR